MVIALRSGGAVELQTGGTWIVGWTMADTTAVFAVVGVDPVAGVSAADVVEAAALVTVEEELLVEVPDLDSGVSSWSPPSLISLR